MEIYHRAGDHQLAYVTLNYNNIREQFTVYLHNSNISTNIQQITYQQIKM